jgi:endogenous inhibitor of DNA gyrase (YacG/DUF329 family)
MRYSGEKDVEKWHAWQREELAARIKVCPACDERFVHEGRGRPAFYCSERCKRVMMARKWRAQEKAKEAR